MISEPEVNIQSFKLQNKSIITFRSMKGGGYVPPDALMKLSNAVKAYGFDNILFINLPDDTMLSVLDEKAMEQHGWIRKERVEKMKASTAPGIINAKTSEPVKEKKKGRSGKKKKRNRASKKGEK